MPDDFADRLTFFIMQDQGGTQQIGPSRTPCILTMTGSAVFLIKWFPQFRSCRIRRWPEPQKLANITRAAGRLGCSRWFLRRNQRAKNSTSSGETQQSNGITHKPNILS